MFVLSDNVQKPSKDFLEEVTYPFIVSQYFYKQFKAMISST